jgi:hypothetical protein
MVGGMRALVLDRAITLAVSFLFVVLLSSLA